MSQNEASKSVYSNSTSHTKKSNLRNLRYHSNLPTFLQGVDVKKLFASCPFMSDLQSGQKKDEPLYKISDQKATTNLESLSSEQVLNEASKLATEQTQTHFFSYLPENVKRLQIEKHMSVLTQEEKDEEERVKQEILTKLFELMSSQPDRFGSVSMTQMREQMSQLYI